MVSDDICGQIKGDLKPVFTVKFWRVWRGGDAILSCLSAASGPRKLCISGALRRHLRPYLRCSHEVCGHFWVLSDASLCSNLVKNDGLGHNFQRSWGGGGCPLSCLAMLSQSVKIIKPKWSPYIFKYQVPPYFPNFSPSSQTLLSSSLFPPFFLPLLSLSFF